MATAVIQRRLDQSPRVGRSPACDPQHTLYLPPGELIVAPEASVVTTILGSCVAVCLTDLHIGVGGINHYLLPRGSREHNVLRFGDTAIAALIDGLLAVGCRKERLLAKVFGGACILAGGGCGGQLGAKNVRMAYETLWQAGIPIVADDVEGNHGRKVVYHTVDGTAWVRKL